MMDGWTFWGLQKKGTIHSHYKAWKPDMFLTYCVWLKEVTSLYT